MEASNIKWTHRHTTLWIVHALSKNKHTLYISVKIIHTPEYILIISNIDKLLLEMP